ncbi:MAG: tetratricopeptide repeat protein [Rhodospirillaceae bacterium]|nr:tetratricopeptide repeat protein [Rhodospirillaceae bacterium]
MTAAALDQEIAAAVALHNAGQLDAAAARYRDILRRHPRQPHAMAFLGAINRVTGNAAEARRLLSQALALDPTLPGMRLELALTLTAQNDWPAAEREFRAVAAADPRSILAARGLAAALRKLNRVEEAAQVLATVADQVPGDPQPVIDLCDLWREAGDMARLLAVSTAGLARHPDHADLRAFRAEALFAAGRLADAWADYAARFSTARAAIPPLAFAIPEWRGDSLDGRAIVIWGEQGLGDEILHAGLVGEIAASAARCRLSCAPRLAALFRRSFPGVEVVTTREPAQLAAGMDVHCPAGSLARWRRPDFASFPARDKYLVADPDRVRALRARYAAGRDRPFLVGVAWRSAAVMQEPVPNAADKSLNLAEWGAIFAVPGAVFVNLQYGDVRADLAGVRQGFGVEVIADAQIDPLGDLDPFAAQVAAMDLVITSSNTAAHMAGALGVPTLVLLPRTIGLGRRWYWFADRTPCPWYPRLRCLVQAAPGRWSDVIAAAAVALIDAAVAAGAPVAPLPYLRGLAKSYQAANLPAEQEVALDALARHGGADAGAYDQLARLRKRRGDLDGALAVLERAVGDYPEVPQLHNQRGTVLAALGREADAEAAYHAGLAHNDRSAELHNNLGTTLRHRGRGAEALEHYRTAAALDPENLSILLNLGGGLSEAGRIDEAIAIFDRILARDPSHIDGHYNRAITNLMRGRFAEGWREFQWRWKRPAENVRPEFFAPPLWSGQDLAGKNVLVYTEQGIGDEIMVATMVPDVLAAAKRVVLLCSERLVPLFARSFPQAIVGQRAVPLPAAAAAPDLDVQMSMSELGACFRKTFADFPRRARLLHADPDLTRRLRAKYEAAASGKLLVGISWRSANPVVGYQKSSTLDDWAGLLTTPGAAFVNLQYGDTAQDRADFARATGLSLIHDDTVDPLKDMDAAAAQIAALDLVISVSNTTVHTAGALGVPTWVLLGASRGSLWYWFRGRDESPWYAGVRLFAADRDRDWTAVMAGVAGELAGEIARRA